MNNEIYSPDQVLQQLRLFLTNGSITKSQIESIFAELNSQQSTQSEKIDLKKILYYIGGFIVLLGIIFFIAQYWDTLDQFSKSLITLGSAVSAYALGIYFYKNTPSKELGNAFFIISIALFPLGIGTTLNAMGISASTSGGISINTILLFLIYFVSYISIPANLFLPFSIFAASTLFFSFTNYIFPNQPFSDFTEYRFLIVGISYLSLGYYFLQNNIKFMVNLMFSFGLIMVLGSTMSLQGYSPQINYLWEIMYPLLLIAVFYLSIKLQNKVFLIFGTLFTFGEVIKITAEYFSQSIGWPLSLIAAGLTMMGVSYVSFELNKKFLKSSIQQPSQVSHLL